MKITNRELLNFMIIPLGDKRFPVKLAFAISANGEEVANKIKPFRESRDKLIDKYAQKDEEGNPIMAGDTYIFDDLDAWNRDFEELLDAEVEMNVTTVKMEDIERCDEAEFDSLTVNELTVIKFMIER